MLRHVVVLTLAALVPLLIVGPPGSTTGMLAVAIVVGALIVAFAAFNASPPATVTNRRLTSYRRRDGVIIETLDPRRDPVRPRAPGRG
jgi:hypothetical protein